MPPWGDFVVLVVVVLTSRGASCDEDVGDVLGEDLYATLGVTESASEEELKAAYRKLARRWHPDKTGGSTNAEFARIGRAFEVLSDREKRRKWEGRRLPPRSSIWDWGGRAFFQVDEIFVPRESSSRRGRRVTRVVTTTLPDGSKLSEAQDFDLDPDGDWRPSGKTYRWNPDDEQVDDAEPHRLQSAVPLFAGEHLLSRDGSHDATVDPDGHLRVREVGSRRVVWQTGSRVILERPAFALLQGDGNVVVCEGETPDAIRAIVWSSNSGGGKGLFLDSAARVALELNDRGELVVAAEDGTCLWASHGCSINWRVAHNALRVTVRRLFDRGALRARDAPDRSLLSSLWNLVFSWWY